MDKQELDAIIEKHGKWLREEEGGERANLQSANLQYADLRSADLRYANLQSANLDFLCLPMWCGGSRFKCSPALIRQIFAHVCSLEVIDADEDTKKALRAIREEAKKSHRASDLGLNEAE